MKSILMSIRPQWIAKILNCEKTIEVRKGTRIYKAINKLIKEQGVAPMFIYCTKNGGLLTDNGENHYYIVESQKCKKIVRETDIASNGKVVAQFNATAEEIICRPICGEWECYTKTLGYSEIEESSCMKNKEIVHYLKGKNGTAIHINDLGIFDKPKKISVFKQCKCFTCKEKIKVCSLCFPKKPLTRAPQSYCFIEV